MRGRARALVVIAGVVSTSGAARAQQGDKPLAEALFQDGRDLLDQNRVAEACAKFAASQRIEPKIGTLLNLAACHEREGKTATAWAEFVEAETLAERTNQSDRVDFAKEHAEALEKKLSRVVIATASPATLTLDGLALDASVTGTAIPLDPGPHVLVASSAKKRTWTASFDVPDGPAEQRVEVPLLADEPLAIEAPKPMPSSSVRTIAGWSALGLGAAGLGVGTIFGVRAFALRSDAEKECTGSACSARGLEQWKSVGTSADVSTVAFGIGVGALLAGAYFLLIAEDR